MKGVGSCLDKRNIDLNEVVTCGVGNKAVRVSEKERESASTVKDANEGTGDLNEVVTYRLRNRAVRVSEKERESASTVNGANEGTGDLNEVVTYRLRNRAVRVSEKERESAGANEGTGDLNEVVTCGPRNRAVRVSEKERESASTVDDANKGIGDLNEVVTCGRRNRAVRVSEKERESASTVNDANKGTGDLNEVVTCGLRNRAVRVSKKERESASTVNDANKGTGDLNEVVTYRLRNRSVRVSEKERESANTINDTSGQKKKRGIPLKEKGENFFRYEGQRSLLSWMIFLGSVPLGAQVKCMNGRKVLRDGRVTEDGIECGCCANVLSLSDFDRHAGSTLGLPFQGICLDSKTSLLRCLSDVWNKYAESITLGFHSVPVPVGDQNDDICNICGDGGSLICCDSCPSAFHQKCLKIKKFPFGDWSCIYCCCKVCGVFDAALPTCRLCEEKYHPGCAQGMTSDKEPEYCSKICKQVMDKLDMLLGDQHQLEEGYSWSVIRYCEDNVDISSLSGAYIVESNAKLAIAWSVLNECFEPIIDNRSKINIIRNIVFSCGSNIKRLNYTGFFIAVLEKGDEIISAATIRLHSNLLAEMPFVGTRDAYRRQGMSRRLLNAVEMALRSMNIEKLVLPAVPDLKQMWTEVFGFKPVKESLKKKIRGMNIVSFPGDEILQKPLI